MAEEIVKADYNEFVKKHKKAVIEYIEKNVLSRQYSICYSCNIDRFDKDRMKFYMGDALRRNGDTSIPLCTNLTFVEKLIQYMDEKKLDNPEVYKKANVDRRLFSKMLSNPKYNPSKDTAIALVLALKLNLENATDMLERAGYALSHSDKRDIIIEYFISEGIYDLYNINVFLYLMNEKPLGRNID